MSCESQAIIKKGSKSFYFASRFFDSTTRQDCWDLYQWCRYCYDQIDNPPAGKPPAKILSNLYKDWDLAVRNKPCSAPFTIVRNLQVRHNIPSKYFTELLDGFAFDINWSPFETIGDLEKYAYHVAGVVGIKMAYVMGVTDAGALQNAVNLGIGMQLTNIARDVREDFQRGRVYLPKEWLQLEHLNPNTLAVERSNIALYRVVLRLIDHAEWFYRSGYQGLRYLPLRAALTISIASEIYREIGRQIRKLGPTSLENRTVVSDTRKFLCALRGILKVLPIALTKISNSWKVTKSRPHPETL